MDKEVRLCPDCGHPVPPPLSLCPQCGLNIEQTQPIGRARTGRHRKVSGVDLAATQEIPQAAPRRLTVWQRVRVVLLSFLSFLCILTIAVVSAGYLGVQQGTEDREAQRLALAEEHYQRGLARLDSGEYELAIAEFEYVLELNPDHPLAPQGIAEAEAGIAARPTPTSTPEPDIAGELYAQGVAAYEEEDWETAARTLSQLRAYDPAYETESVKEMLFTSLYNYGMALLEEDRFEEGIFYLDRAQQIRPLDEDALLQLELAHRYLTALGYWGVNWELCIRRFENLYAIAPGYKDVFYRLYQAHVTYGDLWYEQGEMCPAAAQYTQALELMNDEEVVARQTEAADVCAVATPTPIPPITGTIPITDVVLMPGLQVGRLSYPVYNPQIGLYDIFGIAGGQVVHLVTGGDQPSWQWGGDRLIYRDRLRGGVSFIQPGGQPIPLPANPGAAWPTFSPDGSRYAYAAPDATGSWVIYIARTDGGAEPVAHAAGWGPTWGPAGLLAWTGCEPDGSACGIFVDNPDDDQPATRLTASTHDTGLHWAPGGDLLAYMSDHSGSWDIYLLSVSGGVAALTDDPTIEGLPAWAPDGSNLAFISYRDGQWGLYLMDPGGGNVRQAIGLGTDMPNWQDQRISWAP